MLSTYGKIYLSSSESSEELSKSSIICLITFFQCIYTLLKTLKDDSSQLVWLESTLGIPLSQKSVTYHYKILF